jgi:hypothetical protein
MKIIAVYQNTVHALAALHHELLRDKFPTGAFVYG